MVRRQSSLKRSSRAVGSARAAGRRRSVAAGGTSLAAEEASARRAAAERRFQQFGRAVSKFARSSMQEVTIAAQASRGPIKSIWRSVLFAGRNIAHDATLAWHEMARQPRLPKRLAPEKGAAPPAA